MVDPIMSDHLAELMLRLKRQLRLTSVVVTHDLDLMYRVADRVVFLHQGKVIYFGPVTSWINPLTRIFRNSSPWTAWKKSEDRLALPRPAR